MDLEKAETVLRFMEKYTQFYRELSLFEAKKQTKIVADDTDWLLGSLDREQTLVMTASSMENKRIQLFESLGIRDFSVNDIVDNTPDELKTEMKNICNEFYNLVLDVKRINTNTEEIVGKKLNNIQGFLDKRGVAASTTYNDKGIKSKSNSGGKVLNDA